MFSQVKDKAARVARRAGILSGGVLCIIVGTGFLTAAVWLYLATAYDPMLASVVIGIGYLGAGLLVVGIAVSDSSPAAKQPLAQEAKAAPDAPPLLQAFLYGLQAGATAERRQS